VILGLIALFSSYDHITAFGRSIGLQQQWGIPLIAASVATIFIDSQLATRARDRARDRADQAALEAKRERSRAADEANRSENEANRERNRAAEARERQRKSFERLDQAALLSARIQLDPSPTNRARLRAFLTLMGQGLLDDGDAGMA
jgi:superfamily II DNA helicase RecQ